MINNDRIVPIIKTDYLTFVGTVLAIANVSYTVAKSADVDGNFTVTGSGAAGNILANQPVTTLNFASGVTGATVYFLADKDYKGFKIAGTAVTTTGATVINDGATLYKAVLADAAVTISAVSPIAD